MQRQAYIDRSYQRGTGERSIPSCNDDQSARESNGQRQGNTPFVYRHTSHLDESLRSRLRWTWHTMPHGHATLRTEESFVCITSCSIREETSDKQVASCSKVWILRWCRNFFSDKFPVCIEALLRVKPWPNAGTPNSSQHEFSTCMELGIVWPPTWLELARIWSSLNYCPTRAKPVFHRLATSAN